MGENDAMKDKQNFFNQQQTEGGHLGLEKMIR